MQINHAARLKRDKAGKETTKKHEKAEEAIFANVRTALESVHIVYLSSSKTNNGYWPLCLLNSTHSTLLDTY